MSEEEEEETEEELLDEIEYIALAFRDTFRHNKVIPSLQQWREEKVEYLIECIQKLKGRKHL